MTTWRLRSIWSRAARSTCLVSCLQLIHSRAHPTLSKNTSAIPARCCALSSTQWLHKASMERFIFPVNSIEATDADRFGPKAANVAKLGHAGLPIPDGFCLDAAAYRYQIRALGLEADARGVFGATESPQARKHALAMKLGLLDKPIAPAILEPLLAARNELKARTGALTVVRSSALVEDRFGSSFAGQFESFVGLETESDFVTAVRACWGAMWMTRALRYMATHDIDPAETAMAVLVQPLV